MTNQKKYKNRVLLLALLTVLIIVLVACGQQSSGTEEQSTGTEPLDYPTKPINAISPWTAGGGSDLAFRGYLKYVEEELGQTINVQNITGGNGSIGWAAAAAAEPDGYNMALLTFDILTNEALGTSPNSYKDFDIINMFTVQGMLLITHKDYGWNTLEDFLAEAKKAKDEGRTLKIGVAGEAGIWHQAGVVMAEGTDTEDAYTFVPFEGSADQLADMLGKHLDAIVTSPTAALGHIEEGTLIGLASMTEERMTALPEVPTFKELGYDVKYESWRAVVVPKGTPEPILKILRDAGKKAFDNPEFQKWATEANIDQVYMDSEKSMEYLENLYPVVEGVMKKFNLTN